MLKARMILPVAAVVVLGGVGSAVFFGRLVGPSDMAPTAPAESAEHDSVMTPGDSERGWIGVYAETITPDNASDYGLRVAEGALVVETMPGSPATKAGLRDGDVILSFGGKIVIDALDLSRLIGEVPVGREVEIRTLRGEEIRTLYVVVGAKPGESKPSQKQEEELFPQGVPGLSLEPLDERIRHHLGLGDDVRGVVVAEVDDHPPLHPLDVIVKVDNDTILTETQFIAKARGIVKSGRKTALLRIRRGGLEYTVALRLVP